MAQYDYDIVVIGGGAAGLTASGMAASLGAKTALIERDRTGGECTWSGCVPSKALLRAARAAHEMRTADRYGLRAVEPEIDFRSVMEQVRRTRREIYQEADAPEKITLRGIDLIKADATFIDPHTLALSGEESRTIRGRYFIICSGSSPQVPPIAGLTPDLFVTNTSVFELDELPRRLLVLGAGPVGVEMAQAFRRLGSDVAVVDRETEILPHEEPECAAYLRERLMAEGIRFSLGVGIDHITRDDQGHYAQVSDGHFWSSIRFDKVLIAAGRSPNIDGLGLDIAGVEFSEKGITINHSSQTSVSHIYACGDVAEGLRFTHVAEDMAKTAVMRLLLKLPATYERSVVPWVTFTDPELAHIGKTSAELTAEKTRFETIRFPYNKIDRALTDRKEGGFILLHVSSGKLFGAQIVGEQAGEMINEIALAMKNNLSLRDISGTIHAYPTYLLGVRRAADQWYIRQGSKKLVGALQSIFGYRGKVSSALGSDEIV